MLNQNQEERERRGAEEWEEESSRIVE